MNVPLRQTGGPPGDAWIRRVFPVAVGIMTAAVDLSSQYDESSEGLTDAAALHHAMAVCVVAHLGVTCEWGSLEFNNNPGFAACSPAGDCAEVPASSSGPAMTFGAFGSLADGVAAWVAWVQRSSDRAWELLGSGSVGFWPWFDRAARIAGTPTAPAAAAAFNRVAGVTGEPPLGSAEAGVASADWVEAARGEPSRPAPRPPSGGGSTPRPSSVAGSSSVAGPFALLALGWAAWWGFK